MSSQSPKPQSSQESSIASRKAAVSILLAVLKQGQSLSSLNHLSENLEARDGAFARLLSFGVLRYYQQLEALLVPFIKKPLKNKDLDIQLTMLVAVFQIVHTRVPDYAAVDGAVKQIRKSRKQWAAKMVNAILRNFIRKLESHSENQSEENPAVHRSLTDKQEAQRLSIESLLNELQPEPAKYAHPQWIIDQIKQDWPQYWRDILQGNNKQAPMTLRINQQKANAEEYRQTLENDYELGAEILPGVSSALILQQPRDVKQLPGFDQGWVSVQDAGAQLAAQILQPQAGDHILDACAAPGGKTAHLFESQGDITVTALDISATRLQRVNENCQRLGFNPTLIAADATAVDEWWQGDCFDKILLDVPCSAIGVIRRHPDIKHLRREQDIEVLVQLQREILIKNWPLLKPGGTLLYVTCSVFKAENEQQIEWFLASQKDAKLQVLPDTVRLLEKIDIQDSVGTQLFPIEGSHDGFYYALLKKEV